MDKAQPIWLSECLKIISEPKCHPNENQVRIGLNLHNDHHDFEPKHWCAYTYPKQCMYVVKCMYVLSSTTNLHV